MTPSEFDEVLNAQLDRIRDILGVKAGEYATSDRLHNFKISAVLQSRLPRQALGGMMAKHTTSIYDMINSGKKYPMSVWEEKITDHLNYLILLRAIVEEDPSQ